MLCMFVRCNLECTRIFIIINLLNKFSPRSIVHSIPFSMYVKQAHVHSIVQAENTVTLRFTTAFCKSHLQNVSMPFGTRFFAQQAFQISVSLPHAHPARAQKARCCSAAGIECTFSTANYRSFALEINLSINCRVSNVAMLTIAENKSLNYLYSAGLAAYRKLTQILNVERMKSCMSLAFVDIKILEEELERLLHDPYWNFVSNIHRFQKSHSYSF